MSSYYHVLLYLHQLLSKLTNYFLNQHKLYTICQFFCNKDVRYANTNSSNSMLLTNFNFNFKQVLLQVIFSTAMIGFFLFLFHSETCDLTLFYYIYYICSSFNVQVALHARVHYNYIASKCITSP